MGGAALALTLGLTACGSSGGWSSHDVVDNLQFQLDSDATASAMQPRVESCDSGLSKVGDISLCRVRFTSATLSGVYQVEVQQMDTQGHFEWRIQRALN